jgi:hypothetical protein
MENIKRLEQVPLELLRAKNVSYIVIDGMRLEKKMMIGKAKREALEILQYEQFLSIEGIEYLKIIIKL